MTFLKKLGQVLLAVTAEATGFGPLVANLFGSKGGAVAQGITTVVNDLTAIGGVIAQVEAIGAANPNMTGEQKLQAAVTLVKPILLTSQMISGKHIVDADMFNKGAGEIAQGVCDLLNAIDQKSVATEIKV